MTGRRALIVRGGWDGHHPVAATDMFRPFLAENGFEVRVEESNEVYADAAVMAETDLVVQAVTMSSISDAALTGLRAAVEAGTGLAGWHGGIADSYRGSSDYLQLVGGQFATHPGRHPDERPGDERDNYLDHTIEITELGRRHEITAGVDDRRRPLGRPAPGRGGPRRHRLTTAPSRTDAVASRASSGPMTYASPVNSTAAVASRSALEGPTHRSTRPGSTARTASRPA